ncbi:MAG TPA: prephenate dehydratase [Nitrospiraceae bacterium]|nr:prephenate dehydratase [Nitrospiraceae bacterium]
MDDQKDIASFRKAIDQLDDDLLRLLNERSKNVVEIGKLKKSAEANAHLHTPRREAEIIDRLTQANTGPFPNEAIRSVYREIMSASLSLEGPQKVAYLGPRATFTHLACLQKFGNSAQYLPVTSIKEVFNEVERDRAHFGIVPIENSTEGVVNHTLDMFIDSNLVIYGEVLQEVSHHLLSKTGRMEDIKTIYSHPHAIAQCRNWLETNVPKISVAEVPSTARAAELCANDSTVAAIASELAGELYGLKVVRSRIEDNVNNFTRFLVLSQKPPERTGKDKTSVMLSVKDKVGALYDLLRPFASNGINLTKIESRPSRRKAWEYIFFVDIEGHVDEDRVKKALEEIKGRCLFMKILGSYPIHS